MIDQRALVAIVVLLAADMLLYGLWYTALKIWTRKR